jgi:hypothetical protein
METPSLLERALGSKEAVEAWRKEKALLDAAEEKERDRRWRLEELRARAAEDAELRGPPREAERPTRPPPDAANAILDAFFRAFDPDKAVQALLAYIRNLASPHIRQALALTLGELLRDQICDIVFATLQEMQR